MGRFHIFKRNQSSFDLPLPENSELSVDGELEKQAESSRRKKVSFDASSCSSGGGAAEDEFNDLPPEERFPGTMSEAGLGVTGCSYDRSDSLASAAESDIDSDASATKLRTLDDVTSGDRCLNLLNANRANDSRILSDRRIFSGYSPVKTHRRKASLGVTDFGRVFPNLVSDNFDFKTREYISSENLKNSNSL